MTPLIDRKTECARDLRDRILSYELPPGHDLDETSISREYGLSRTPLREIFQNLRAEGYITISANRGAKAAPLDLPAVQNLFQSAVFILSGVMRLAVEHRDDEQIETLRDVQAELANAIAVDDARSANLLNHRFHEVLGEMSHCRYLIPAQNRLLVDYTRLARDAFDPTAKKARKQLKKTCNMHERLIEAISDQKLDRALALTLSRWDIARAHIEKAMQNEALEADVTLLDAT